MAFFCPSRPPGLTSWLFTILLILLGVTSVTGIVMPPSAQALQVREERSLNIPQGLERDIGFWEMIFSRFSAQHCVFHDRDDLRLVYVAKRLETSGGAAEERTIRRYMGAIRAAFAHLAQGGKPRNLLENRIYTVTPPELREEGFFRRAMDNIRCQKGIDMRASLERASAHVTTVRRVIDQYGLPGDLTYLPLLESGYNPRARSRAGAKGLWQFMPGTARQMGLKVSPYEDHRSDVVRATHAASRLLLGLFRELGDWSLAITAYNYGPNGMARAVKLHGPDYLTIRSRHQSKLFGFAARNYYPSFLAARNIAKRLEAEDKKRIAGR